MPQQNTIKEELSSEILLLKKRIAELETLNAKSQQAEELLRSREKRFEQLLENSFDNIVVLDADGIQRYVSQSVVRTLGFQPAELMNISVVDQMIHPDDQQKAKEALLQIINGRQEHVVEYRHRHKNGGWVDLEAWGTNQLNNPDIKGIVINCRVVTERKRMMQELEEQKQALQNILDNTRIHLWAFDGTHYIYTNKEWFDFTGQDPASTLTIERWVSAVHPDDRVISNEIWMKGWETKTAHDNYFRLKRYDGVYRAFYCHAVPIYSREGVFKHFQGFNIDITERKQAEESLKGAVQRFQLAASAARAGVWDWDLITGEMVWDERMLELYGETRGSFMATIEAWKNGLHPDDVVQAIKECEAALRGERQFNMEFRLLFKNGTVKHIKADGLVIRDNEGRPLRMIGLNIDITERKRVEMLLRDEQKRMNTILDTVGDPIFVKDSDFCFVLANRAFYDMLGLKENDVIGSTLAKDLPADEMQHFFEIDQRVLDTGKPDLREESLTVKDGRTLTILTRKACLIDDSGKRFVVGAIHDITEIKNAEELLRNAKEAAEEANKAKGEFLNNIAHDFRTPMQAIMGFTSFFQSENLTARQKKYADIISEKSKGLLILVEELLDVSRLEAGRIQLRSIPFDLKESIEKAVDLARGDVVDKDVKVVCLIDGDIPKLRGDEVRFNQILTNLLSNAVKYTDNGEILVKVILEQGSCSGNKCCFLLSVKDTGLGIPKDKQGSIFDAYTRYQEFNGTRERGGVGLGLYITKTLLELMGGTISVVSEVGTGSEFVVTLELDKA